MSAYKKLGELQKGQSGKIVKIHTSDDLDLVKRMMEMGLIEGSEVHIVHESPFGGDPIAVRSRGAIIALRRSEANLLEVLMNE